MKSVALVLFGAVVLSVGTAQHFNFQEDSEIPVFDDAKNTQGKVTVRYVTENGISVNEVGRLKTVPGVTRGAASNVVFVKEGSYSFTSPEGEFYRVDYIADENGYRVKTSQSAKAPALAPYP